MAKSTNLTSIQLIAQADALYAKAQSLIDKEKPGAIIRARQLIADYGLTVGELGLGGDVGNRIVRKMVAKVKRTKASQKKKVAGVIKFRDDLGNSWTGQGRRPRWITEAIAGGASEDSLRVD